MSGRAAAYKVPVTSRGYSIQKYCGCEALVARHVKHLLLYWKILPNSGKCSLEMIQVLIIPLLPVLMIVLSKPGTREAAFVYAIAAASVSYSVTKDCSSGELKSCSCDRSFKTKERRKTKENWRWAGCSDDVHFGNNFSKSFLDARVRERHFSRSRILMNLHNNEAGRRVSSYFHINV